MKNEYSSLKIFHHKDALDAIECGRHQAPFYIRIKPTNLCNHHCAYCTYGSGENENKTENRDTVVRTDMIPWGKMQEIIQDMSDMGVKAVTFSGGGEPLTYPHILDTVKFIKKHHIELSLISNGQLLSGQIANLFYDAKWVRISFDSPNEDDYTKFRKVSKQAFQQVCGNIRDFAQNKNNDCVLGINFVISKANYSRVYEAAKFLKNLGVNNVKFAAMVANRPSYHKSIKMAVLKQIHQAQKDFNSEIFTIINNYESDCEDKNFIVQPFPICYTCRLVTVIAADQKVYYCHTRAYDSEAILGDLRTQSLKKMWFSEETIKKLSNLKPTRDCKNFCAYEQRNKLIQAYYDVDYRHINFI